MQAKRRAAACRVIAPTRGFNTAAPREVFLTAPNYLHLQQNVAASETAEAFRRASDVQPPAGLCGLRLASSWPTAAMPRTCSKPWPTRSRPSSRPKLELAAGTTLVLDQGPTGGDQLGSQTQIVLAGGTVTVEVAGQAGQPWDATQAAVISGNMSGSGGLTKTGAGVLVLSGANTYTGATAVEDGTLLVTGSTAAASSVTVTGATLGGTGTVAGP